MISAYAIADVRAAEAEVMAGLPDGELMSRAATQVAAVAREELADTGGRVVALVGSGDNGGDALFAVAQLAQDRHPATVILVGSRAHEAGLDRVTGLGVPVLSWRSGDAGRDVRDALAAADVVIDGITGIGGRPGLREHLRALPDLLADDAVVLAVDLPSGADPAGVEAAPCLIADRTVTFSLAKPVHLMPATEPFVGQLTIADIGVASGAPAAVQRLTEEDVARLWPVPGAFDDKYRRGVLGVVAGGPTYTGAPVMTVTAAVTAGVGMVRYVGPPQPADLVRAAVPEAVFGTGHCQAWVIGPGWDPGVADGEQTEAARNALASDLPVLLDAGGLDLIGEPRDAPTLLTPHAGELARLADRIGLGGPGGAAGVKLAQQVADSLHATVLLKGAITAVVPPSSRSLPIRTQAQAPSWLATAGAGDVLAGICGALLACGLTPLDAGSLGAMVHGLAAHDANPGGPVRALDVAHRVGRTVSRLLAASSG